MERPSKIPNKECRDYIDYLEDKLKEVDSRPTLVSLYKGYKKQAQAIADLMNGDHLRIDLSDKDDKAFDRIFKIFEKLKPLMDTLMAYEKDLIAAEEEEDDIEAGSVEDIIYGHSES
jgi:vacuolar-type H+-ATPase subunit E/Vma4